MFQRICKARKCPVCMNADVFRVKRTGFPLKLVCGILNVRPHWCPNCDTFFLGPRQSRLAQSETSPVLEKAKAASAGHADPSHLPR